MVNTSKIYKDLFKLCIVARAVFSKSGENNQVSNRNYNINNYRNIINKQQRYNKKKRARSVDNQRRLNSRNEGYFFLILFFSVNISDLHCMNKDKQKKGHSFVLLWLIIDNHNDPMHQCVLFKSLAVLFTTPIVSCAELQDFKTMAINDFRL